MTMSTSSRLRRPLFGLSLILMAAAAAIRLLVAGAPSWLAPLVFVGATLVAGIAASAVGAGDCSADSRCREPSGHRRAARRLARHVCVGARWRAKMLSRERLFARERAPTEA